MSDLRDRWQSLSPRERDAAVARARAGADEERCMFCSRPENAHGPAGQSEFGGSGDRLCPVEGVSSQFYCPAWRYRIIAGSASHWRYAGPLLDEMLAAGCELEFVHWPDRVIVKPEKSACYAARGETWPEVIALAYVLWRQSQEVKS